MHASYTAAVAGASLCLGTMPIQAIILVCHVRRTCECRYMMYVAGPLFMLSTSRVYRSCVVKHWQYSSPLSLSSLGVYHTVVVAALRLRLADRRLRSLGRVGGGGGERVGQGKAYRESTSVRLCHRQHSHLEQQGYCCFFVPNASFVLHSCLWYCCEIGVAHVGGNAGVFGSCRDGMVEVPLG